MTATPLPGALPASRRTSLALSLSLSLLDLFPQRVELALVEHLGVHHANEDLLDRSIAELVDNAANRTGGDLSPRLGGAENIGAALDCMCDVALLFQAAQNGPHGRLLQPTRQLFAHGFRRHRVLAPDERHDCPLKLAKVRKGVIGHSALHVTLLLVAYEAAGSNVPAAPIADPLNSPARACPA